MKPTKLLLTIIMVLLVVNTAQAVGITPATTEIMAGEEQTIRMRIFNEDQTQKTVTLELSGELKEYLQLSTEKIEFAQGQRHQEITLTIKQILIENFQPDKYVNRVVVKQETVTESSNIARVGVSSRIIIVVPGDGPNLEGELFVPNFVSQRTNTFSLDVKNTGNSQALNCVGVLRIYSSLNERVATIVTDPVTIKELSSERIPITWEPYVNPGRYVATANINCDNANANMSNSFHVGSPEIVVDDIFSDNFRLGQISQLKLVKTSLWADTIPGVFAQVDLEREGETLTSYTTAPRQFRPQETQVFDVFLNTENVDRGTYDLFVRINYLDKETETKYVAQLERDSINLEQITGRVVGQTGTQETRDSTLSIIILVGLLLVGTNAFLVYHLVIKKRKDK